MLISCDRYDGLGIAMRAEFEEQGYYVLRGILSEAEVDRLAGPIRAGFEHRDYDSHRGEGVYPQPGIYSMGPRVLETHPEIAEVSLAHPKIISAIEGLFGEPAMLAQFWSIMRPPGAGITDNPFVNGSASHYDYKPWRCVGSSVKWMFAIIPFVDYIESAGPLMVSPGSHRQSALLPSNGRVHPVDAARVPKAKDVRLINPELRKGDVVLMDGFCWHEARPNYGNTDRCGLYMKFQAQSAPPACGPTIYPSAVHETLSSEYRHLVPHHRDDGRYAAVRSDSEDLTGPVGGVDEGQLLIEDAEDRLLLLGNETEGWQLPRFDANEDDTAGILDVCNVMGSVKNAARDQLGLLVPWMSWLEDTTTQGTADL
ncbi:MAG: phytanoyl-CoA dioxygenase family protein, partial [Pseudomonadota bacterium]